jgi:Zinc knuckle
MATQMMATEPLFYGDNVGKGLSAEEFIRTVDNLAASNRWDAAITAAKAISYLREDALFWLDAYKTASKANHARMIVDYNVFKGLFILEFYKIAASEDLNVAWAELKQKEHEKASTFCFRVITTVGRYAEVARQVPQPADAWTVHAAALAAFEADITPQTRQALVTATELIAVVMSKESVDAVCNDIALKFAAEGLRSAKLREKMRVEIRKRLSVMDTVQAVASAEKAAAAYEPHGNHNGKKNTPNRVVLPQGIAPVDDDEEDDGTNVEAVKQKQKKKKTKATAAVVTGPKQDKAKPATSNTGTNADSQRTVDWKASRECFNCHTIGHISRDCPAKVRSNVGTVDVSQDAEWAKFQQMTERMQVMQGRLNVNPWSGNA